MEVYQNDWCWKCNGSVNLEYTEGMLGSLGYEGRCSVCNKFYFIGLGSLELKFNTKMQNKMTINEMLQAYVQLTVKGIWFIF